MNLSKPKVSTSIEVLTQITPHKFFTRNIEASHYQATLVYIFKRAEQTQKLDILSAEKLRQLTEIICNMSLTAFLVSREEAMLLSNAKH